MNFLVSTLCLTYNTILNKIHVHLFYGKIDLQEMANIKKYFYIYLTL